MFNTPNAVKIQQTVETLAGGLTLLTVIFRDPTGRCADLFCVGLEFDRKSETLFILAGGRDGSPVENEASLGSMAGEAVDDVWQCNRMADKYANNIPHDLLAALPGTNTTLWALGKATSTEVRDFRTAWAARIKWLADRRVACDALRVA